MNLKNLYNCGQLLVLFSRYAFPCFHQSSLLLKSLFIYAGVSIITTPGLPYPTHDPQAFYQYHYNNLSIHIVCFLVFGVVYKLQLIEHVSTFDFFFFSRLLLCVVPVT